MCKVHKIIQISRVVELSSCDILFEFCNTKLRFTPRLAINEEPGITHVLEM